MSGRAVTQFGCGKRYDILLLQQKDESRHFFSVYFHLTRCTVQVSTAFFVSVRSSPAQGREAEEGLDLGGHGHQRPEIALGEDVHPVVAQRFADKAHGPAVEDDARVIGAAAIALRRGDLLDRAGQGLIEQAGVDRAQHMLIVSRQAGEELFFPRFFTQPPDPRQGLLVAHEGRVAPLAVLALDAEAPAPVVPREIGPAQVPQLLAAAQPGGQPEKKQVGLVLPQRHKPAEGKRAAFRDLRAPAAAQLTVPEMAPGKELVEGAADVLEGRDAQAPLLQGAQVRLQLRLRLGPVAHEDLLRLQPPAEAPPGGLVAFEGGVGIEVLLVLAVPVFGAAGVPVAVFPAAGAVAFAQGVHAPELVHTGLIDIEAGALGGRGRGLRLRGR